MIFKVVLLFVGTVIAFWLSAICGGGASLILIPILNVLLPLSVVPFSLTIGTFTNSISRITIFRKYIKWEIVLWFVPFSLPSVWLGAWLIKFINPLYLQWLVALFLISNLPQLFKKKEELLGNQSLYPKYILAIIGFLAGFVSGITGAIGLLFNRFYLKYGLTKEEIVATRAANEIFLHMIKLIIYIALGLYSTIAFYFGLCIAIGSVVSALSVKYILPYLSEVLFRKIGYGAMVVSGIFLLINTTSDIIRQDKISLATTQEETVLKWKESQFVLEFAFDDGLEIERPVEYSELPDNLKSRYNQMSSEFDEIKLEKVFKFGEEPSYEFYAVKNNKLSKFEFSKY